MGESEVPTGQEGPDICHHVSLHSLRSACSLALSDLGCLKLYHLYEGGHLSGGITGIGLRDLPRSFLSQKHFCQSTCICVSPVLRDQPLIEADNNASLCRLQNNHMIDVLISYSIIILSHPLKRRRQFPGHLSHRLRRRQIFAPDRNFSFSHFATLSRFL